jgi:iron complex outermembrane receptor protein
MGRRGNLVADFSYRDRLNDSDFVGYSSAIESDSETWALTPRYVWDGRIGRFADRLVAGVDIYWSEQEGESFFGTPLSLSGLSAMERDSHGFYLRNELYPLESLILSLGVRRERVAYDLRQEDLASGLAPLDESLTESETAYSAGLTLTYSGRSSVFARFNRSFRLPLVDEMAIFDYYSGAIKLNAELQPQIGNHYEVGVRHYFTPQIQGRVTFFRAEIDDEIFFNSSTFNNENHPETLHQGFEIGGRADLYEKVTLFGNYTYTKATFEKDPFEGNDIPAVPRHRANLGIQIYNLFPGLRFSADYEYVGNSYAVSDQPNAFDKLDDYYTVNARVAYKWNRWQAFLGVNNITDQEYSEYAVIGGFPAGLNFYPAPATTWLAGLKISF